MGLFNRFKKTDAVKAITFSVASPVDGEVVFMEEIPDDVFATGALGKCFGITPAVGIIGAPVDGEIIQLSDTLHAVGILGNHGEELLIHVGVDTVEMKGEGFEALVKVGDKVTVGQQLLNVDLEAVKNAGHPSTVITVITNSDEFSEIKLEGSGLVNANDKILEVTKA